MTADQIVWAVMAATLLLCIAVSAIVATFYVPVLAFGCFFPEKFADLLSTALANDTVPQWGTLLSEFLYPTWGAQGNELTPGYLGCIGSQSWDALITVTNFVLLMLAIMLPFQIGSEIWAAIRSRK